VLMSENFSIPRVLFNVIIDTIFQKKFPWCLMNICKVLDGYHGREMMQIICKIRMHATCKHFIFQNGLWFTLYKRTFNYKKKNLIGPTTRIVSFVCQVLSLDFEWIQWAGWTWLVRIKWIHWSIEWGLVNSTYIL
jgi:hypothetical protein